MKRLLNIWPIIGLLTITVILFLTNYTPGTYLIGWDNLLPELNFRLNIQRSIFAVWQEYQSLGLLGGMAHSSDLIRQLFLGLTSYVLPTDTLRYFWTFLTLFIGGSGAYLLIKHILEDSQVEGVRSENLFKHKIIAFIGALFYLLNIATIQTYFTVFETFSAHFASLPWIFFAVILYLKSYKLKNFIFLFLVFLLSAPSFYVPTLFVVTVISIAVYLSIQIFRSENKKTLIKRSLIIFSTLFIMNAYWFLPFSYYTLNNSGSNIEAKINQMATQTIRAQNEEFGNFGDTALLKGFMFNSVDLDAKGNSNFMFARWRNHFTNPLVPTTGYVLFLIMLTGLMSSLRSKIRDKRTKIAFASLFLFSFSMLAQETFPFSIADQIFRLIPLFDQAFRFPFTKFGILAALTFSIMLAFGIYYLYEMISKLKNIPVKKVLYISIFTIPCLLIFWIALPAFKGHFFYNNIKAEIPNEYFQVFDYFKNQDQNARIANLPQPAFWGWTNYRWENGSPGGSGFLWYGIKQPILDRAFDVWSENSENYYYELSSALYSKDPQQLANILRKYQISYILIDENVIYPASPKSLAYAQIKNLISALPNVKEDKKIGKITIYKAENPEKVNSFVFTLPSELPVVEQPFWKTSDIGFKNYAYYISKTNNYSLLTNSYLYPFGSLFSQKPIKNRNFTISENENSISISSDFELKQKSKLIIPNYIEHENIIPVEVRAIVHPGTPELVDIVGYYQEPGVKIDGRYQPYSLIHEPVFSFEFPSNIFPITVSLNGVSVLVRNENSPQLFGTGFLTTKQNNTIVATAGEEVQTASVQPEFFKNLFPEHEIEVPKGKHTLSIINSRINDNYLSLAAQGIDGKIEDCNTFRVGNSDKSFINGVAETTNINSSTCISFPAPNLFHKQGYAVFVDTENKSGRPFHFWVLNEDEKVSIIDTYLDKTGNPFVLYPMEAGGQGYSFHFDNTSIGNKTAHNVLNSFSVYPIPAKLIENIHVKNHLSQPIEAKGAEVISVEHPNESLYVVQLQSSANEENNLQTTLALSQSYDPGWTAYYVENTGFLTQAFPFIFGERIKSHIKLNDWENGWVIEAKNKELTNKNQIIIAYLPQYLEYAGFALLGLTILLFAANAGRQALRKIRN